MNSQRQLSLPLLSRIWQMLLKGLEEVGRAPNPLTAAEMVLIRIAHTADLPTPDEVIRALGEGTSSRARQSEASRPETEPPVATASAPGPVAAVAQPQPDISTEPMGQPTPVTSALPETFEAVVELVGTKRDAMLKVHLEEHVSLIDFEPGRIEFFPLDGAPKGLAGELGEKLTRWTGTRWVVSVGRKPEERPIGEIRREKRAAEIAELKSHPAIATVLETFPDAEISDVKPLPDAKTDSSDGSASDS